jgi:alpha-L-rhamnosidase
MGATTIWERWDSMLPDGTINPGQMTSFNHYALGAVADWLHRTVAGLAPAAPGYRRILVRPIPGGGLTHASARLDTPYGPASVAWRRAAGRFHLEVTVPPGTEATVHVPGTPNPRQAGPGTHRWDAADPTPATRTARTVRDAFDDPHLWSALTTAAVDVGAVPDPVAFAGRASRWFDHPLAVLPRAMGVPGSGSDPEKVEAALSAVLARHG